MFIFLHPVPACDVITGDCTLSPGNLSAYLPVAFQALLNIVFTYMINIKLFCLIK